MVGCRDLSEDIGVELASTETGIQVVLEIAPGNRFEGTAAVSPGERRVAFRGWIEFMAAIDSLRNTSNSEM